MSPGSDFWAMGSLFSWLVLGAAQDVNLSTKSPRGSKLPILPSALLAPLLEDQRVCVTAYFCFFSSLTAQKGIYLALSITMYRSLGTEHNYTTG